MLDNLFELIDFNTISQSNDNTDCSITIVGMPNVGKSSLLNAFSDKKDSF